MPATAPGFQPAGRAPAPPPLDLVQDFVNTEIPEWARDDIATPELLRDWLVARELLAEGDDVDPDAFVAARALRAALRRLALLNTVGGVPDGALCADFGAAVEGVRLLPELAERGDVRLRPEGAGAGERALAEIVKRVYEAQANGTWSRLKACRKPSCGWLFYDASRNASSTWCSMSICGNRTKTAAYRSRRRSR